MKKIETATKFSRLKSTSILVFYLEAANGDVL